MIKVIGLQRTGTNWVQHLLAANFTEEVEFHGEKPCWKHALPLEVSSAEFDSLRRFRIILVAKRPEAWFYSICRVKRAAWKAQMARRRPGLFKAGEIDPLPAAKLYEQFYSAWLARLKGLRGVFVRYEDLLRSPDGSLARIGAQLGLDAVSGGIRSVGTVPQSRRWSSELTVFYLGSDFGLSPDQQKAVESIDRSFLKSMGYK